MKQSWLSTDIIGNIFEDPVCGDGVCESSAGEFAAFGTFGCASDCDYFRRTSEHLVEVNGVFESSEDMISATCEYELPRQVVSR